MQYVYISWYDSETRSSMDCMETAVGPCTAAYFPISACSLDECVDGMHLVTAAHKYRTIPIQIYC